MFQMLHLAFQISGYFGACALTLDPNSQKFSVDENVLPKLRRSFILAILWNILAYVIVLKRFLNEENLDEFHLTLAWCLGYTLLVIAYSIFRFHSYEICDTGNGLVKLLNTIKGKLIYSPKFTKNLFKILSAF